MTKQQGKDSTMRSTAEKDDQRKLNTQKLLALLATTCLRRISIQSLSHGRWPISKNARLKRKSRRECDHA